MNKNILIIGIIVVVGSILRVIHLGSIPSGFFCDEASIGYNAFSLLTKGTDEYGTSFPIFFRAFGEYKNPIEIYSTIPFIALFGLSEFSVRIVSVMYGILGIVSIYLLTAEMFSLKHKNYFIAFLSAFFLSISPWHIHLSRVSLEGQMAFVFLTTLALAFFYKSFRNKLFLPISLALFSLAIYGYFPARIFIPFFGLGLFIIYFKHFITNKKNTLLGIGIALIVLLPYLNTLSTTGLSRWQQVSIFTNPPQNTSVVNHIANNYLSHFSIDYLFLKGDIDMPNQFITRHSVRGIGELYLFQLPLIVLGFAFLIQKKQFRIVSTLLLWLILYPTGSMFTTDQNVQATRSLIGVIPFQILSALGIFQIYQQISKYKSLFYPTMGILIITMSVSLIYFLHLYFVKYPQYSSDFWGWQYGAKDIVHYFVTQEENYDELIMAPEFNAPHIFFKFYAPNDCQKCKIGLPHETYNAISKQLYAITPVYLQTHPEFLFLSQKTIYYPNSSVAFYIGQIYK